MSVGFAILIAGIGIVGILGIVGLLGIIALVGIIGLLGLPVRAAAYGVHPVDS